MSDALNKLMKERGPVNITSIKRLQDFATAVNDGVCVAISFEGSIGPISQFTTNVFTPLARRIHRGRFLKRRASDYLMCVVRLSKMSLKEVDFENMHKNKVQNQRMMKDAWEEVVKDSGGWDAATGPPPEFEDILLTHGGTKDSTWKWKQNTSINSSELLGIIIGERMDKTIQPLTLKNMYSCAYTVEALRKNPRFPECEDATNTSDVVTLRSLEPCILHDLESVDGQDYASKVREILPDMRAVVFLPMSTGPMPWAGVPPFNGIWNCVDELADCVAGAIFGKPTLRKQIVLLPSDASDMMNVPTVCAIHLLTGKTYAYGSTCDLLNELLECNGDQYVPMGQSVEVTRKDMSPSTIQLLDRASGKTSQFTKIMDAVRQMSTQRNAWREKDTVTTEESMFPSWRAAGCDVATRPLPFNMGKFDKCEIGDKPANELIVNDKPVNVAYMRGLYLCAMSGVNEVPMLNRLKLVIGAGITRNLLNPWKFWNFQNAKDSGNGQGTRQMMTALLRNVSSTIVLYLLDRNVSIGDMVQMHDVVPSTACGLDKDETPGNGKYNVDKWGIRIKTDTCPPSTAFGKRTTMDVFLPPSNSLIRFNIGVVLDECKEYPYVAITSMDESDTVFSQLPRMTALNDPAISLYFAGTRYQNFSSDNMMVRSRLGEVISTCCPSPSYADVYTLLSNYPLFISSDMHHQYHMLSAIGKMDSMVQRLNKILETYAHKWRVYCVEQDKLEPPITPDMYNKMGDMTVIQALFAVNNKVEQFTVFGRVDNAERTRLSALWPARAVYNCPYSENAVKLLESKGLPFNLVQVYGPNDPTISVPYPTIPVVLRGGKLIGGFDKLKEYIDSGEYLK
jgi:hypothetical protein